MPVAAKLQTSRTSAKSKTAPTAARTAAGRTERNCSVARTLDIVSDAWAFLIIREAFFGTQTFEAFRSALGIPRATLTDRLKKLTQLGIFRQVAPGSSQRKEYRLTKMGFDLYPSFIALMQFGDRWLSKGKPPPLTLVHATCGCESHPIVTCSHCGESISARDAKYRDGPGAGRSPAKAGRNTRRPSDGSRFMLGRPSSVSRALEIIGDKWSFMVVREGFFGNRRYDKILNELAIAPNILTDRLNRLVARGVLRRRRYQTSPDRYEYLLTDMGLELYGSFIAMLRWGDRWLSKGKPPLILTHIKCGHDFDPVVDCDRCKTPIVAADMRYRLAYDPKSFGALGPRSVD
ncbi:transcriptional regulator [Bradyrhizobium sp. WBAH42]|nr:transcriptional regulator [Bradyrhizobium sp. WBAH30]MDD1547074.1 transcriptional regulator [Bradyrhizobium sp. WBAH41]MDD1560650.1 transcriptional regulator [Bradyrhizobium sp. WBAH23]MDD1568119.1 transcriptional regulator [Bradyrhizobium sp. WBAH33]MDD1594068.1 transcriptional regulator [Bradyrhizobium sp. WBAH42]NRB91729.1 transcriptional regulator [Bradyrhizobium sp. WBAH10]QCJ89346.1 transcriptional regulator [Bradyrhizobium yuanmingense]